MTTFLKIFELQEQTEVIMPVTADAVTFHTSTDVLGKRRWNWNGTETNYFVNDGQQVVADLDATGGVKRAYVYAGLDRPLAMTVYTGTVAKTYFYLTDHLGSVQAIADETGEIVESYRYDAWGRVLGIYNASGASISESAIGNRFLWSGKDYSYKAGLYYNRFRIYDPISGRFLSKDPIGIAGGINNDYAYCSDNPVCFRDSIGLCKDGLNGESWFDANIGGYLRGMNFKLGQLLSGLDALGNSVINSAFDVAGLTPARNWLNDSAFLKKLDFLGNPMFIQGMQLAMMTGGGGFKAPEFPSGILSESEFLSASQKYLGKGYKEVSSGRYLSQDGSTQVRYGTHETRNPNNHHAHFEALESGHVTETSTVEIIP